MRVKFGLRVVFFHFTVGVLFFWGFGLVTITVISVIFFYFCVFVGLV